MIEHVHSIAFTIFAITYAGVALGGIPGLVIDRTGIAILGAASMVVFGVLTTTEAVDSIDIPTILLLYSLMVVSSQFRLGGFYTKAALKLTEFMGNPRKFLLLTMLVSAGLSAVLTNDIICLAFTPVLTVSLVNAGLNPIPFLIGLSVSSNIGSAATIIGNPQNMLIGQSGRLHFGEFFMWCAPPAMISLLTSFFIISIAYKNRFTMTKGFAKVSEGQWPSFDRHQTTKGIIALSVLILLFFTAVPRELTAIAIAGLLLCSRKLETRSILGFVDWHLITLFCGLFIVVKGIEITGIPLEAVKNLKESGFDIQSPYILTTVSIFLSNFVSNVPAVMLITKFLDADNHSQWFILALSSTFAGNLITVGSIANLIVIEKAKELGVSISFAEHAKIGIAVTLSSFVITFLYIAIRM
jgi:Na+/H+ antiporter NhaD/arsenite permease-like protein